MEDSTSPEPAQISEFPATPREPNTALMAAPLHDTTGYPAHVSSKREFVYYGQFDPPVDQFLHERYFMDAEPGKVFIECGAFDGTLESSGRFFEETLHWKAYNIEPSPKIFAQLEKNRPNSVNLNVALSNEIGTCEFTDVIHPQFELCTNGSLKHGTEHASMLQEGGCEFRNSTVQTTTFDAFVKGYGITEIELMVLDVEGHEFEVLERFPHAQVLPRVLCVEHGHLGAESLMPIIEPLGYRFDTAKFVNSFYVRVRD